MRGTGIYYDNQETGGYWSYNSTTPKPPTKDEDYSDVV
jgi:hypothetical protein